MYGGGRRYLFHGLEVGGFLCRVLAALYSLMLLILDEVSIRDRGSDLYVGIDMVKNYCLYKWYGRCSAKKGQKLSQITPN